MIRRSLLVAAAFALAGLAVAGVQYGSLPAELPVHWGLSGQPDAFAPKAYAILYAPAVSFLVPALVVGLLTLDPRKAHVERSEAPMSTLLMGLGAFGFALQMITLRAAMSPGQTLHGGSVMVLVGLLMAVLGNALPKVRSNWFFGIRTPWTLQSEAVWHRTHRVGGWTMALSGLAAAGLGLVAEPATAVVGGVGLLLLGSFFPVVYSYVVWREVGDTPAS
jgi:uncharacterized membrane protein